MGDLRQIENDSIRAFVTSCAPLLAKGRILDYGCGRSPYRDLVAGLYVGYEDPELPAHVAPDATPDLWLTDPLEDDWDAILCTQVIQYCDDPWNILCSFKDALTLTGGPLVMTGPTNWPEVEPEDLHRFTCAGIRRVAVDAGFTVDRIEERAHVMAEYAWFSLGWGMVATA